MLDKLVPYRATVLSLQTQTLIKVRRPPMPTFDVDNLFKQRVRAIAKQLSELGSAPLFDSEKVINITVTFEKDGDAHVVHFPGVKEFSVPR